MEFKLIGIGRTKNAFIKDGMDFYSGRINKFYRFNEDYLQVKHKSEDAKQIQKEEAIQLQKYLDAPGLNILLDEKGKTMDTIQFSNYLQNHMNQSHKAIKFFIGGAYGFDASIRQSVPLKIRLSDMTFSHQIIRLIFAEQLYRAITVMHGHPYHNV